MSNRKKAKAPWLGRGRKINGRGVAKVRGVEDVDLLGQVTLPEGHDVEVIKEVPATVDHPQTGEKVEVGIAYIHDDGSVAIKFDKDAPKWALDLVKDTSEEVGYSLGPMFPPGEGPDGSA